MFGRLLQFIAGKKKKGQKQDIHLAQAYSVGPDLDPFVDELLMIDRGEGLLTTGKEPNSAYAKLEHIRGREIGQILCNKGGVTLMRRVGTAFVDRGGREGQISFCWHGIRDKDGDIWLA